MTEKAVSVGAQGPQAQVLDHAAEFVEIVYRAVPGEYEQLLDSGRFDGVLKQDNPFNNGKLFAYAEFVVFRREFRHRFPKASRVSCINAFCKLFLKNDISITNLVNFAEGAEEDELLLLKRKS